MLQFFLLFILALDNMLKSVIVLFFILHRQLLFEFFSLLNQIGIGGFVLGVVIVAPDNKGLSHKFLHFVIEIFLTRILDFIQPEDCFLQIWLNIVHSKYCLID